MLDTKNNDPLGSTQVAGFCLEQRTGTNRLEAWVHVGGDYKKAGTEVKKDEWNHVMFTYDAVMGYLPGTEETIAEDIDDVLKLSVRTAADKTGSVSVKLNSIEFNSGVTGEISSSADLVTTFVSNMYDVNSDGKLDLDDVAAVQALYRAESGEEQWNAAADITASENSIELKDGQTSFSFEIGIEEEKPFAGAEFGITLPDGVALVSVDYLDDTIKNASHTPVVVKNVWILCDGKLIQRRV